MTYKIRHRFMAAILAGIVGWSALPTKVLAQQPTSVVQQPPTSPELEQLAKMLYADLPHKPTDSYLGAMGVPVATGETRIGLSGWEISQLEDSTQYLNQEVLEQDALTLVANKGETGYGIVPLMMQVEYPENNSSISLILPEDVTVLDYSSTEENPIEADEQTKAEILNQTYQDASASVQGVLLQAEKDFTAQLVYTAASGQTLIKSLQVQLEQGQQVPLWGESASAVYGERPTPAQTTGKITKVEKVSGTWLIWFNGEEAYCCDNGLTGKPDGSPTYNYTDTSIINADQYVPGDHAGNQIRIWGGLHQMQLRQDAIAELQALTDYQQDPQQVLSEFCKKYYNEQQQFIIEHYPDSEVAKIYLESAQAALEIASGVQARDTVTGYYTYIYTPAASGWQRVALIGPAIQEEQPKPTYDASWSVIVEEQATANFEVPMTVKVNKYTTITNEQLSGAEITITANPSADKVGDLFWQVIPASQTIYTQQGKGTASFVYQGSVTNTQRRSQSGTVSGFDSQQEADAAAAQQKSKAEATLRQQAKAEAEKIAQQEADKAAQQARAFLLEETGVPKGFAATDSSQQTIAVQPNGEGTAHIANQPWQAEVRWEKLDGITGGRLTEDTEFYIYEWSNQQGGYRISSNYKVIRLTDGTYTTAVTNDTYQNAQQGFVYFTQDNQGKFKLEEKTAPYGYTTNTADGNSPWIAEFVIDEPSKQAYFMGQNADRNIPWGNQLVIHKTDSETGNPIAAQAQWSLYEWNVQQGIYQISTNYAVVRAKDGSYTVQCLRDEWSNAEYGSLYFEDTLCDLRQDTQNHDNTTSKHTRYYTQADLNGYGNQRTFTNDGQFLIVEHKAPDGYLGDWTNVENVGKPGSDLGKRAYYIRITGDGTTITLGNADYNADIATENNGGTLVETADGVVSVTIYPNAQNANRELQTGSTLIAEKGIMKNIRAMGEIILTKVDLDAMRYLPEGANGTSNLEGALYDLYAAEDIQHPDGVFGTVDYAKLVDASGNPIWSTTIKTNGGWDTSYLPVLKKDYLVASAQIEEGMLTFSNLYLGKYYLVERATGVILPLDESEHFYLTGTYPLVDSRLQPTGQYGKLAQKDGEYTEYVYKNQYSSVAVSHSLSGVKTYDGYYLSAAVGYLCDEVNHYQTLQYQDEASHIVRENQQSQDEVLKSGFELKKYRSTTGQPSPAEQLEGAGFTVYRIDRLSKADAFIQNADGSYDVQSILKAYRNGQYDSKRPKYDFSAEGKAVATMFEGDAEAVKEYNATLTESGDYANGKGEGWQPTQTPNEYRLAELFTNQLGTLRVQGLAYGQYLVVETTVPKDVFQADPFVVSVNSTTPQSSFTLPAGATAKPSGSYQGFGVLNEEMEGYLQLVKMDAETGKPVKVANTGFSIYQINKDGTETLLKMQDPTSGDAAQKVSVFYTDQNGRMKTPEKLPLGRYRIVEVEGPDGFYNDKAYSLEFEITSDRVWQVSGSSVNGMDDYMVLETYYNHETLGQITIEKQGEVLADTKDGQFVYKTVSLGGAVFAVYAKSDIYTQDGQGTLWYKAGDLVETLTTGQEGQVDEVKFAPTRTVATHDFLSVSHTGETGRVSITLPLGEYTIKEVKPPYGFTLSDVTYDVTLAWDNQTNDIVLAQAIVTNSATGQQTQYFEVVNAADATEKQQEERVLLFKNDRVLPVVKPGQVGVGVYKLEREDYFSDDKPYLDGVKTDPALLAGKGNKDRIPEGAKPIAGATYGLYTTDDIYDVAGNLLFQADELLGTAVTDMSGFAYFSVDVPIRGQEYGSSQNKDASTNSGRYYVRELQAPEGVLPEQSVIPLEFTYEGMQVAWQIVDCLHSDRTTEVELKKLAYKEDTMAELPGAELEVVDWDGKVIDRWTSQQDSHLLKGLWVSDEGEKEYIYTLREVYPAEGYATAREIPFMLKQSRDENGKYLQSCEVWVLQETPQKQIQQGSIISPTKFSDESEQTVFARLADAVENAWNSLLGNEQIQNGKVIAHWTCTENTLVVEFTNDATQQAIDKCLRENDFASLTFETVILVNGSAEHFYPEKQAQQPLPDLEQSYSTQWVKPENQTVSMVDLPTVVEISKLDITTQQQVVGATLELTDEQGTVMERWVSGEEPHKMEGKLSANKTYTLTEVLPPNDTGYVTANSIRFIVADSDAVQHVLMQDDYTKLEVSKQDAVTGQELVGAVLQITNEQGQQVKQWTSDGTPHRIERLVPGTYILTELSAPDGYMIAEPIVFVVDSTDAIQCVVMKDSPLPQDTDTSTPAKPLQEAVQTGDKAPGILTATVIAGGLAGLAFLLLRRYRQKNQADN